MPKMKTHSGAKKRYKVTGSGKILRRNSNLNHILEKKSPKRKRHHGASALAEPDFGGMLRRAVEDDPFDSHWLRQAGKNPLAERSDRPQRTSIPADLAIILRRLPRRERGLIA